MPVKRYRYLFSVVCFVDNIIDILNVLHLVGHLLSLLLGLLSNLNNLCFISVEDNMEITIYYFDFE